MNLHPATKQILLNRFPFKDAWDLLAIAQLLLRGDVAHEVPLSVRQKLDCLRFYFTANGVERLFVTSNRSGSRWSQLALELALDLRNGGGGTYDYEDDHFYPLKGQLFSKLDWRTPSGLWIEQHPRLNGPVIDKLTFLATHNNYSQLRTRKVASMKTIVVTRSIPAVLASLYSKLAASDNGEAQPGKDEDAFPWDAALQRLIDYFNSWGDVMTWHRSIRHYRYEDIYADPVSTHMEMLDFWGLPVEEQHMTEALARTTKTEMIKRMPAENRTQNRRVSVKSQAERRVIPEARFRSIIDRLNRELKYDFGYAFDYDTPYDTAYN